MLALPFPEREESDVRGPLRRYSIDLQPRAHALRSALIMLVGIVSQWSCSSGTEPDERFDALVASLEAVTPTDLSGMVGTEVVPAPSVRVLDNAGNPVAGVRVSFSSDHADVLGNSSVVSDASGIATVGRWQFGPTAGLHTLVAAYRDRTVQFSALVEPGPIARIVAVTGGGQIGRTGSTLREPLQIRVTDYFGNAIGGAGVTFSVVSGGGTLGGSTATTGPDGVAVSGAWTLGTEAGPQHVRAEAGSAHVLFTAEACEPERCPGLLFVREGNIYSLIGGEMRQLTFDGISGHPAWSPDGRRIAFARDAAAASVYIMDADGSHVEQKTSGRPFHSPSWAPDGQSLALAGDWWVCLYECSIYRLELGSPQEPPLRLADMGADPAWSPDGKKIAFVSLSGDDGYHALDVMNADGTGLKTIVPRDDGTINHPAWSPDGTRIAFSKCHSGACDIYLVALDGSGLKRLTTLHYAVRPSWSPDGTGIAFERWDFWGGTNSIEYITAAGGDPVRLVSNAHSPAWRP
jgi:hypothetical protein